MNDKAILKQVYDKRTEIGLMPLSVNIHASVRYLIFKRICDVVFAIISLLILSPVFLVVSILVKATSSGPVIFKQERLGLDGKSFLMYKFRSMCTDAEKSGPSWAAKDDSRTTSVGYFLRKYHIDEIPQLVNILLGSMSVVGPRPERAYFYRRFSQYIPEFYKRLAVKPGLTGWAQINGGYDIGPREKLEYDMEYINKASPELDLLIILKTLGVVIRGDGAR